MIGKHGSFGSYPRNQAQVVEVLRTFKGAFGFQCVTRSDYSIEFSRHRWFKDRMLIEIGEEELINERIFTKVIMSIALNPVRHPFSGGKPSIDITLLGSAISDHMNLILSPAYVESSQE